MKKKGQGIYFKNLIQKIKSKDLTIGIIGLGYVGLPRALSFSEKKINVIGFDIKEEVVNTLNKGKTHIKHINQKIIRKSIKSDLFITTTNFSKIKDVDVIIICLPTPLKDNKKPDLDCILSALNSIKSFLRKGHTLILESTTYPGTTDEILKPFLEKFGFKVGYDIYLIYSPEREDPANNKYKYHEIPKLLGGITKECTEIGRRIYELLKLEVVILSSTKTAELTKLLENIYRAINIGMVNEMKELSDCFDIDLYEVIDAASTKPFGFKAFYPGPGVGGHCIPIDPYYLSWKAKEFGIDMKLINSATEINSSMPKFVVKKVIKSLEIKNKQIRNSKILVLGISYKKNIDDFRESTSLEVIKLLRERKAKIYFNDPYIEEKKMEIISKKMSIKSIEITADNLKKFDCTLLITDHDSYNYKLIESNSNLIIDTRGKFNLSNKIIRA